MPEYIKKNGLIYFTPTEDEIEKQDDMTLIMELLYELIPNKHVKKNLLQKKLNKATGKAKVDREFMNRIKPISEKPEAKKYEPKSEKSKEKIINKFKKLAIRR